MIQLECALKKNPRTCWKQSRFIMLLHVSTVFPPLFMTFVEHQFCFLPWLSSRSLRAEFFTFVRCRAQYVSSSIGRHYRRHLTRFSLKALSALPPPALAAANRPPSGKNRRPLRALFSFTDISCRQLRKAEQISCWTAGWALNPRQKIWRTENLRTEKGFGFQNKTPGPFQFVFGTRTKRTLLRTHLLVVSSNALKI